MPTTLASTIIKPERLPVNPRRHKVPIEARKRVSKACNACNVRRAKCSGGQPCERCQRSARECQYPVAEETINITRREYNELLRKCQSLDVPEQEIVDSVHSGGSPGDSQRDERSPQPNGSTVLASPDAPQEGRILQDPDGTIRYLGESSGATFLNHLREYMATVVPKAFNMAWPGAEGSTGFIAALGRYQTHDSRPLLTSTIDPLTLPTKEEALKMLSELRYWTQDGAATIESGGIYYWANIDDMIRQYHNHLAAPGTEHDASDLAMINAAFALACQFSPSCAPNWDSTGGQVFFARARGIIGNPLDVSTITDASTLSLLGFYLMNCNRRDAAYIYISLAMHILVVHGVHRAWMIDEDGKRLFWTVYNLDRWLSCLMGRPPMIPDEAIKLDLPRDSRGLPSARGLCAHIQLSRISNFIVCNVFDVSKQNQEPCGMLQCIQKALILLKKWRSGLPQILQYVDESFSQDRAVYELRMAYNQLLILAVRPLLFEAVKTATANICVHGRPQRLQLPNYCEIGRATEAARQNIHLCQQVLRLRQPSMLTVSIIHYCFNAALSLELHGVLLCDELGEDREQISLTASLLEGEHGSNYEFARDCAKVLKDLVSVIHKLRSSPIHRSLDQDLADAGESESPVDIMTVPRGIGLSNTQLTWNGNLRTSESTRSSQPALMGHLHARPDDREPVYSELLSWLQAEDTRHPS